MKKIIFNVALLLMLFSLSSCFLITSPSHYRNTTWKTNESDKIQITIEVGDSGTTPILTISDGTISKRFGYSYVAEQFGLCPITDDNKYITEDGSLVDIHKEVAAVIIANVTKGNEKVFEFNFVKKDFYKVFYNETIDDESLMEFHLERVN